MPRAAPAARGGGEACASRPSCRGARGRSGPLQDGGLAWILGDCGLRGGACDGARASDGARACDAPRGGETVMRICSAKAAACAREM